MFEAEAENVYAVRDRGIPDVTPSVSEGSHSDAIIIDNGSSEVRAGYANCAKPQLVFDNVQTRYRPRKAPKTMTLIGNDTWVEPGARSSCRSPFDGNVVANWDVMEGILDYTFLKLSVAGNNVDHPIVMTECVATPYHNRSLMSELLFELYGAPSVAYGVDALFSSYYNTPEGDFLTNAPKGEIDAGKDSFGAGKDTIGFSREGKSRLVISSGNASTHVIPVVDGRGLFSHAKRLNWGGSHHTEYMLRLCQLKYPSFPLKVTPSQAESMLRDHCYVSSNYLDELNSMLDHASLDVKDRIVQFPWPEVAQTANLKSEEELRLAAERRKEAGRKLQMHQAQLRTERIAQREMLVQRYQKLLNNKGSISADTFLDMVAEEGFASETELKNELRRLESNLKRSKRSATEASEEPVAPECPLLDVPDSELDATQLKLKRQQKLLKASYDSRMRIKQAKDEERLRIEAEREADETMRRENFSQWLELRYKTRDTLYATLKEKQRAKLDVGDRKSLANQQRMKNITDLVGPTPSTETVTDSQLQKTKFGGDDVDQFGDSDSDWSMYRELGQQTEESLEDEEKRLVLQITELETLLEESDPQFDASTTLKAKNDPKKSMVYGFLHGVRPFPFDETDLRHVYQLHLNVERIRVPEAGLFQPSLAGLEQAGIPEIVRTFFESFQGKNVYDTFCPNIFLTGRNVLWPGFTERLRHEIQAFCPTNTSINITVAQDPAIDPWRGALKYISHPTTLQDISVSKHEWAEFGPEYMKEHSLGNWKY